MVLEALLKAIRAAEPTDKCVLVSNYTGRPDLPPTWIEACWSVLHTLAGFVSCNTNLANITVRMMARVALAAWPVAVVHVPTCAEALDVLAGMCAVHNWVALRLDGSCSVKQRQALVDTFNDPKVRGGAMLISSGQQASRSTDLVGG